MFCKQCGAALDSRQAFCSKCGGPCALPQQNGCAACAELQALFPEDFPSSAAIPSQTAPIRTEVSPQPVRTAEESAVRQPESEAVSMPEAVPLEQGSGSEEVLPQKKKWWIPLLTGAAAVCALGVGVLAWQVVIQPKQAAESSAPEQELTMQTEVESQPQGVQSEPTVTESVVITSNMQQTATLPGLQPTLPLSAEWYETEHYLQAMDQVPQQEMQIAEDDLDDVQYLADQMERLLGESDEHPALEADLLLRAGTDSTESGTASFGTTSSDFYYGNQNLTIQGQESWELLDGSSIGTPRQGFKSQSNVTFLCGAADTEQGNAPQLLWETSPSGNWQSSDSEESVQVVMGEKTYQFSYYYDQEVPGICYGIVEDLDAVQTDSSHSDEEEQDTVCLGVAYRQDVTLEDGEEASYVLLYSNASRHFYLYLLKDHNLYQVQFISAESASQQDAAQTSTAVSTKEPTASTTTRSRRTTTAS